MKLLTQNEVDLMASLKYRMQRTDHAGRVALIRDERYVKVILKLIEWGFPIDQGEIVPPAASQEACILTDAKA